MDSESKLVPILREGIEVAKLIFFKELQGYLASKYPDRGREYCTKLSGAVINDYFGTPSTDQQFKDFVQEEKEAIASVLSDIGTGISSLRIPLTDALRIMILCDSLEGQDNSALLAKAQEYGILLIDREMPMPNKFIELIRRLGEAFGILNPLAQQQ